MANEYYSHTTFPSTGSSGSSALMRAEFDSVDAGFTKLPVLAGNAGKLVLVNSTSTGLEANSVVSGITLSSCTISGGTISGVTFSGITLNNPNLTGVPTAPTAGLGTNTTQVATTAFVTNTAFSSALPAQTGNSGKFVTTNGTTASWAYVDGAPPYSALISTQLTTSSTPGTLYQVAVVPIDSNRDLVLVRGSSGLWAFACNLTTGSIQTPVQVRNAAFTQGEDAVATLISSTQVLVASCRGTAYEAVVLSIDVNQNVTVNTAATATLASAIVRMSEFVTCGSSYIVGYSRSGSLAGARAHIVSGTTVTIGSEITTTGASNPPPILFAIDATSGLMISASATFLYAKPFTVASFTLTGGTEASTAATAGDYVRACYLTTGRYAVAYTNTNPYAAVVNVAANVATMSVVQMTTQTSITGRLLCPIANGKAVYLNRDSGSATQVNLVSDTAGTASAGTAIAVPNGSPQSGILTYDASGAVVYGGTQALYITASTSGASANPTVSSVISINNGTGLSIPAQGAEATAACGYNHKRPIDLGILAGATYATHYQLSSNQPTLIAVSGSTAYVLTGFAMVPRTVTGKGSDDSVWGVDSSGTKLQVMKVKAR